MHRQDQRLFYFKHAQLHITRRGWRLGLSLLIIIASAILAIFVNRPY